jgi:hypothetical protein
MCSVVAGVLNPWPSHVFFATHVRLCNIILSLNGKIGVSKLSNIMGVLIKITNQQMFKEHY